MPRVSEFQLLKQVKQPVILIRTITHVARISKILGGSFMKLGNYLDEMNETPTDIPYVCYPDFQNINENEMNMEIGFPVSASLPGNEDIIPSFLPEGKFVFCLFKGQNNDEMLAVYDEMMKWIAEHGYEIIGDCYEYYLNGPPFPEEDMLTRIVLPLK